MTQTGVRSGLLLFVLGLWVLLRTTHRDDSDRTLIDHILGPKSSSSSTAAAATTPGATTTPGTTTPGAAGAKPATKANTSSGASASKLLPGTNLPRSLLATTPPAHR